MPVTVTIDHLAALPTDLPDGTLVAVGVRAGSLADDAPGLDPSLAAVAGFEGKAAQTLVASTDDGLRLLVGLGETPEVGSLRKIGAAVGKAALKQQALVVDLLGPFEAGDRVAAAEVLTEGLVLGTYRFEAFKDAAEGVVLATVSVVAKGG